MTTGTREWHETTTTDRTAPTLGCDWDDEEDDDPDDEENDDEDADEEDDEEPGWYVSRPATALTPATGLA